MTAEAADRAEKPSRKQQQRSLITQQRLLDAAVEVFAEIGYKATSTRNIAQRASVHHPLIAYHFRSKEELWRAAAERIFGQLQAALEDAMENTVDGSRKSRMAALIQAYVTYATRQPAMHRFIVVESARPSPRLDWLVRRYLRPFIVAAVDDMRHLQQSGVAPRGNPALLVNMIRILACGLPALIQEMKQSSNLDLSATANMNALADLIVDLFLPGDALDDDASDDDASNLTQALPGRPISSS